MDCKAFYGADVTYFRTKTAKQIEKYKQKWGQGAIIYKYNYCTSLQYPNVILLDSVFPLLSYE